MKQPTPNSFIRDNHSQGKVGDFLKEVKQAGISGEFYDQLMQTAASSRTARSRLDRVPGGRTKTR